MSVICVYFVAFMWVLCMSLIHLKFVFLEDNNDTSHLMNQSLLLKPEFIKSGGSY